jgi:structural maintenance of chromosome 1
MPVTYLELENFKSYGGFQRIGPLRDFTSIIGPNGSGKSNCMDAISFVLGVQSRDLRSSQMRDLIYRPAGTSNNKLKRNTLRCRATLVYKRSRRDQGLEEIVDDEKDGNESANDSESEEIIRFSRSITPAGHGEYHVNNVTCTFAEYEKRLADIGVLVKARNFLVFQGDVENLARKSPSELVALMENISGSGELKQEYEKAAASKEEAEQATLFSFKKQKALRSERRILKEQKEEADRFHNLVEKKASIQTDLYMWLLYHLDQDRQQAEEVLVELKQTLAEHEANETTTGENLKEAKKKASEGRRVTQQADKKRVTLAAKVDNLDPELIKLREETKNLTKKIKQDENMIVKKRSDAEAHVVVLRELDEELASFAQTQKDLEKEYDQMKTELANDSTGEQVHLTSEQEEELLRVQEAAATASAGPRRDVTKFTRQLGSARSKLEKITQALKEAKVTFEEVQRDVREFTERKEKLTEVSAFLGFYFNFISYF